MLKLLKLPRKSVTIAAILLPLLVVGLLWTVQAASARILTRPTSQPSPLHPTFPLLDGDGDNVLDSGGPVSTMNTCGACHDTDFIANHSFHADAGLNEFTIPGGIEDGHIWDTSPGIFGKWNPIQYRYLSSWGDERLDLGTPEWLMTLGVRHVGGGPAVYSRDGNLLAEIAVVPDDPQTHIIDHQTGETKTWDWGQSGVVEMNCFLCHIPDPDNAARMDRLHAGDFAWANTLILGNSGIIQVDDTGFQWNPDAFLENGDINPERINIQNPTNQNCGQCHGLVHDDVEDPLVMSGCSPDRWRTITTGQIISPQRLSDSGMNLANKEELDRSWDIHAERLLKCTNCHYSLNNPLYYLESETTRPEHLDYDPRRVDIGEYLEKPLHQFARGDSVQSTIAPELKDTMRRCDSCHETVTSHSWLPYTERHMQALSCETCHIPQIYSSANQLHDWTVIHLDESARTECRGVEGNPDSIRGLLTGYKPVWLPRENVDGDIQLAPYNLVTAFYWVYGDPPRPVPLDDLKATYLDEGDYHPGVLMRFDADGDGKLSDTELIIDNPEKAGFITERLTMLGLGNPRITGEIQAYSINHNIGNGEWAIGDCQVCHSQDSRVTQGIQLSFTTPGGVTPTFFGDDTLRDYGVVNLTDDGGLIFQPEPEADLYVLGNEHVKWVDLIGLTIFLGTIGGVTLHGGLRLYNSRRIPGQESEVQQVYMYAIYERLWHWLQTAAIILLIATGLVIHKPDIFGIFGFKGVVLVHNIIATILGFNAFLSLFYHLTSGDIKQYIPRPRGFFDRSILQLTYYLRGIFRNENHPFEKTPEVKLNPLQQLTYIAILNVLLPLQGITGILIWGTQCWPKVAASLGGLSILAPLHTMIAWLFASFVVLHVYLTTTGHKPLTAIKAMTLGWEDVELHESPEGMEYQPSSGDD